MKRLFALLLAVFALAITTPVSAQNGGYWLNMGAPGGKQDHYNNGVYYGPKRAHRRPAWNGPHGPGMVHPRGGIVPPRAVQPQTAHQYRQQRRGHWHATTVVAPIAGVAGYVAGRHGYGHQHGVVSAPPVHNHHVYPGYQMPEGAQIVNPQTGEWVIVGGKPPSGPAPHGKVLVEGKPGDPGCVMMPTGNMRCPNRWVDAPPVNVVPDDDPGSTDYPPPGV